MTWRTAAQPRLLSAYVAGMVVVAVAVLVHGAVRWQEAGVVNPAVVPGAALAIVVVCLHPLTFPHKHALYESYLDSAVLVVLALLAAPGEALWAYFVGQAISLALLRRSILGRIFNLAQCTVAAAAALAVAGAIGAPSGTGLREAAAIVALSLVYFGGTVAGGAVFSQMLRDRPIGRELAASIGGFEPLIPLLVNSLGYLAVVLIRQAPVTLVLLIAPVAMVMFSSRAFLEAHQDRMRMRSLVTAADAVHASASATAVFDAVIGQTAQMLRTEVVEVSQSPPRSEDVGIRLPRRAAEDSWLVARHRLSGETFAAGDEQALRTLVTMASTAVAHVDLLADVRHQANHDPLTGLPNRAILDQRLAQLITAAAGARRLVGLVFVDLDGFKQVNDSFGHHVGDVLLCHVAARLRAAVRETDLVVRLSGDEFCVVLTSVADASVAWKIAENLRRSIHAPFEVGGACVGITASVGIAVAPGEGVDAANLLRIADSGMYAAKRAGKDAVGQGVVS